MSIILETNGGELNTSSIKLSPVMMHVAPLSVAHLFWEYLPRL